MTKVVMYTAPDVFYAVVMSTYMSSSCCLLFSFEVNTRDLDKECESWGDMIPPFPYLVDPRVNFRGIIVVVCFDILFELFTVIKPGYIYPI